MKYVNGDIFKAKTSIIVNPVNCVGVSGKGLALQFKKKFPDNFKSYNKACKDNLIKPGVLFIHKTKSNFNPRLIINFPTKRHYNNVSDYEEIQLGLNKLLKFLSEFKYDSIAIPPLGCGLGKLKWRTIKLMIETTLAPLDNDMELIMVCKQGEV